jgi:hypothetical protein
MIALRFTRRWGPHRVGYHLGVPRSTVGRVLGRYRMPPLAHLDQATRLPARKPKTARYEMTAPGQLVYVVSRSSAASPTAAANVCSDESTGAATGAEE